ncbi:MAG TPA: carbonic anhydrase [Solirubrobacteraceae bacterium]|jgi:carbonic anhydrase
MPVGDEMLAHATAPGRSEEMAATAMSSRPNRRVVVLTCMDTRIDPYALLGLARGEAHILRNAGGLVTDDVLRSLAASQRLLGTAEVVVVMHRGCGLEGGSDEDFHAQLSADGPPPSWRLGAFADVEQALREGLARLRESAELVVRDGVRGFIFDPANGTLEEPEASG